MGTDKGLVMLAGKPMVAYLLHTLRSLHIAATIIANKSGYESMDARVIPDLVRGKGPLGGILTALTDAGGDVLILSADAPFVNGDVIRSLLSQAVGGKVIVVKINGRIQPLCAIYPLQLKAKLEAMIAGDELKVMLLLQQSDAVYIEMSVDEAIFSNINSPQELLHAEAWLKKQK